MSPSISERAVACCAAALLAVAGCADTGPVGVTGDANAIRLPTVPVAIPQAGHFDVFEVTIENLTTSQPLSPGVIATHDETVSLFEIGEFASEGIRLIAEEGDPSVAVAELEAEPGAFDVLATDMPIHINVPGAPGSSSLSVQVRANGDARYVSIATMLVCTNDGFTGANALPLPDGAEAVTYYVEAYTSGTELNNELSPYIADGCGQIGPPVGGRLPMDGNDRIPTMEPIAMHPGIHGTGDLVLSRHSWRGPIARITIARVPAVAYDVTIENLSTGQPLSPGVLGSHDATVTLFEVGDYASEGIRLIAEAGNPSVAADELLQHRGTFDVVTTTGPIHRIGGPGPSSQTVRIRAGGDARYLSLATMLICTNDGFTGGNALQLPEGAEPVIYLAAAYDAGTELDNELTPYLSDSCGAIGPVPFPPDGNDRIPTMEVIEHHAGIHGMGDLIPELHGWTDPIVRITVVRVP